MLKNDSIIQKNDKKLIQMGDKRAEPEYVSSYSKKNSMESNIAYIWMESTIND